MPEGSSRIPLRKRMLLSLVDTLFACAYSTLGRSFDRPRIAAGDQCDIIVSSAVIAIGGLIAFICPWREYISTSTVASWIID